MTSESPSPNSRRGSSRRGSIRQLSLSTLELDDVPSNVASCTLSPKSQITFAKLGITLEDIAPLDTDLLAKTSTQLSDSIIKSKQERKEAKRQSLNFLRL